jgi:hypothetical protein
MRRRDTDLHGCQRSPSKSPSCTRRMAPIQHERIASRMRPDINLGINANSRHVWAAAFAPPHVSPCWQG